MCVTLEFENSFWAMAEKLKENIQPGDYKDVILGLIFHKYISDRFEKNFYELEEEGDVCKGHKANYTEYLFQEEKRWQ